MHGFGKFCAIILGLLIADTVFSANPLAGVQTVFIILMENHNWSSIQGNANAPYINHTLLPMASYCLQYFNPPGNHPSEPNYLWLEAGTNFGILNDNPPSSNQQTTTNHLVSLLNRAGVSWKAYQENITGTTCPTTDSYPYAVRHNPFMFFTDVTANLAFCTNHVRPYSELAQDLRNNRVAQYNFITPNLTNDMHDAGCTTCNAVAHGDLWLFQQLPVIMGSSAYSNHGAIFITWDEGSGGDGPIGMIVVSPLAKGGGYSNTNYYMHGSTLRTMQEIFGVQPYLGAAANAADLSDLFAGLTLGAMQYTAGLVRFTVSGAVPGRTHIIEVSVDLKNWTAVSTNVPTTTSFIYSGSNPTRAGFYRVDLR